ncbi:MAG: toll/interleukin-1 receptor domain-containing protein [Bacteroidota bacterium]
MPNLEHVYVLKNGVEIWNQWREANSDVEVDLRGADLTSINLAEINLAGAKLADVNFSEANLKGAKLKGAKLINTELVKAELVGADLRYADLSLTDLSEADLQEAKLHFSLFSETIVEQTHFYQAPFGRTSISDTDLSVAHKLDTCYHFDVSSIDNLSLRRSYPIPKKFLQGLGFSEWEIEQARLYEQGLSNNQINEIVYRVYDLRATQAVQIGPIFISYCHKDGEFVDRLCDLLSSKGIRFWRDAHRFKAGRIEKQLDRAMRLHELVIVVLSKFSVKSDWVEHEIKKARKLEKEAGRDIIVPIALDDEWKRSSWPERLREQLMEYNITDFSEWHDEDALWTQFANLLNGIGLFYK